MKIQRYIDKTIKFLNSPVPANIKEQLMSIKDSESPSVSESLLMKVKNDINLSIEKIWTYDAEWNDIYVSYVNLGYGTVSGDMYKPIDEISFAGVDIRKLNIGDEINYLIGCAFPFAKIER